MGTLFFGIIAVDSIEIKSAPPAVFHGFIQQSAFPDCPEYQPMILRAEKLQSIDGKRDLRPDFRITVTAMVILLNVI